MASTYTSNNGLEKIGTGEQAGTWGTTTNTNFDIIDRAINGVGAITLSGTTHTLTTTDGAASEGHYKVLVLGGSPSGTNTITISPNDQDKLYFVYNNSGQTATFTQGSGGNISITTGKSGIIYADGAGSGAKVSQIETGSESFTEDMTIKTGDGALLTLQTSDTTVTDGDVLGALQFQAPNESGGTDAIAVAASIVAEADNTFAADNNQTDMVFKLGSSEAATEKMRLTHEGDLNIITDGKSIQLGADSDTTLTHVADTGILLNSTRQLQFGDSGTYIHQSADGVLDLVADSEIEINATTIDINGAVDCSGVVTATGFTIGSAVIAESELEQIDGITAGTVSASKAVVVDSSKDITGLNDVRMDSLGVATAASGTSGQIRATNDITAYYSDERLKDIHGSIENALDKVLTLDGFIFSPNEKAQSLGYDGKTAKAGVSAQKVQEILPEAVVEAPISPDYLTVQHDQLIPLLVNAIKELKSELDEHKKGCQCNGSTE